MHGTIAEQGVTLTGTRTRVEEGDPTKAIIASLVVSVAFWSALLLALRLVS
jgi:hypothetical protein